MLDACIGNVKDKKVVIISTIAYILLLLLANLLIAFLYYVPQTEKFCIDSCYGVNCTFNENSLWNNVSHVDTYFVPTLNRNVTLISYETNCDHYLKNVECTYERDQPDSTLQLGDTSEIQNALFLFAAIDIPFGLIFICTALICFVINRHDKKEMRKEISN